MIKTPKPPYLHIYKDNQGKLRVYYRRDGRNEKIEGVPWTPEWLARYQEIHASWKSLAQAGGGKIATDTFEAQALYYMKTLKWKKLNEATQSRYRRELKALMKGGVGKLKVTEITRGAIIEHRDRIAEKTPRRAVDVVNVIRYVLQTAVDNDIMPTNPADRIGRPPGYEPEPRRPWTDEEIDLYLQQARPAPRRALLVLLHTGLRVGDAVKVRRSDIVDGRIPWQTSKRQRPVEVPVDDDLAAELATPLPVEGLTLIVGNTGRPLKAESASKLINQEARRIGINPVPTCHGLRANAVRFLIEAGCEIREICAITGQSPDIVEHYGRSYNRSRLVDRAIVKINDARRKRSRDKTRTD